MVKRQMRKNNMEKGERYRDQGTKEKVMTIEKKLEGRR